MKKKILIVFGTRPEAIKMAPLVRLFQADAANFETRLCITAQHREMLDQVLAFFELTADYDLDVMKPNQDLYSLTADIITGLKAVLQDFNPDFVFVHGDTTTTLASSLAGFYAGAKVCHVEAGLRTHNKWAPFPEEINRSVAGRVCDYHFAPTALSKDNLLAENIAADHILVTGNTVIDALQLSVEKVNHQNFINSEVAALQQQLDPDRGIILVTGHRRENHGQGFLNICEALKTIAQHYPELDLVYPVHLNPKVQQPVYDLLGEVSNIHLIAPLGYPAFVWLMEKSHLIITDSGGVQEEAPSLGKPVLVMRDTTERPEAVAAGTVSLVGTDVEKIVGETRRLLDDAQAYETMSKLHNPYGDGKASERIVDFIKKL